MAIVLLFEQHCLFFSNVSKLAAKGWYNSHHTPEQNQTKVTFLPIEMWEYFKSIILKNNEQFSSVYNAAGLI